MDSIVKTEVPDSDDQTQSPTEHKHTIQIKAEPTDFSDENDNNPPSFGVGLLQNAIKLHLMDTQSKIQEKQPHVAENTNVKSNAQEKGSAKLNAVQLQEKSSVTVKLNALRGSASTSDEMFSRAILEASQMRQALVKNLQGTENSFLRKALRQTPVSLREPDGSTGFVRQALPVSLQESDSILRQASTARASQSLREPQSAKGLSVVQALTQSAVGQLLEPGSTDGALLKMLEQSMAEDTGVKTKVIKSKLKKFGKSAQSAAAGGRKKPNKILPRPKPSDDGSERRKKGNELTEDPASDASQPVVTKKKKKRSRDKPYKCGVCDRVFGCKSHVVEHMRTHTGEKPYECPICQKQFSQKSNISQHMNTHTKQRPFKCSDCGRDFMYRGSLYKHKRLHTGERPYSCGECGRKFTHASQLFEHIRTHTNEKPFSCGICGRKFAHSGTMHRHQRAHFRGKKLMQFGLKDISIDELYGSVEVKVLKNPPKVNEGDKVKVGEGDINHNYQAYTPEIARRFLKATLKEKEQLDLQTKPPTEDAFAKSSGEGIGEDWVIAASLDLGRGRGDPGDRGHDDLDNSSGDTMVLKSGEVVRKYFGDKTPEQGGELSLGQALAANVLGQKSGTKSKASDVGKNLSVVTADSSAHKSGKDGVSKSMFSQTPPEFANSVVAGVPNSSQLCPEVSSLLKEKIVFPSSSASSNTTTIGVQANVVGSGKVNSKASHKLSAVETPKVSTKEIPAVITVEEEPSETTRKPKRNEAEELKIYACNLCGHAFCHRRSVKRHKQAHHPESVDNVVVKLKKGETLDLAAVHASHDSSVESSTSFEELVDNTVELATDSIEAGTSTEELETTEEMEVGNTVEVATASIEAGTSTEELEASEDVEDSSASVSACKETQTASESEKPFPKKRRQFKSPSSYRRSSVDLQKPESGNSTSLPILANSSAQTAAANSNQNAGSVTRSQTSSSLTQNQTDTLSSSFSIRLGVTQEVPDATSKTGRSTYLVLSVDGHKVLVDPNELMKNPNGTIIKALMQAKSKTTSSTSKDKKPSAASTSQDVLSSSESDSSGSEASEHAKISKSVPSNKPPKSGLLSSSPDSSESDGSCSDTKFSKSVASDKSEKPAFIASDKSKKSATDIASTSYRFVSGSSGDADSQNSSCSETNNNSKFATSGLAKGLVNNIKKIRLLTAAPKPKSKKDSRKPKSETDSPKPKDSGNDDGAACVSLPNETSSVSAKSSETVSQSNPEAVSKATSKGDNAYTESNSATTLLKNLLTMTHSGLNEVKASQPSTSKNVHTSNRTVHIMSHALTGAVHTTRAPDIHTSVAPSFHTHQNEPEGDPSLTSISKMVSTVNSIPDIGYPITASNSNKMVGDANAVPVLKIYTTRKFAPVIKPQTHIPPTATASNDNISNTDVIALSSDSDSSSCDETSAAAASNTSLPDSQNSLASKNLPNSQNSLASKNLPNSQNSLASKNLPNSQNILPDAEQTKPLLRSLRKRKQTLYSRSELDDAHALPSKIPKLKKVDNNNSTDLGEITYNFASKIPKLEKVENNNFAESENENYFASKIPKLEKIDHGGLTECSGLRISDVRSIAESSSLSPSASSNTSEKSNNRSGSKFSEIWVPV